MMVVAVIVIMFMIMLVPAEEGSDLHGFSFLGFACWDFDYSYSSSIAVLCVCSMGVALGLFQHLGLGRIAVDLQANLAARAGSAVGSDKFLLRVRIDDAEDFGLAL